MRTTITRAFLVALLIVATGCGGGGEDDDLSYEEAYLQDLQESIEDRPSPAEVEAYEAELRRQLSPVDLTAGVCMIESADSIDGLDAVACDEPHDLQVLSVFDLPAGSWPGLDEVGSTVEERCSEDLRAVPADTRGYEVDWLAPLEATWELGDREAVCYAVSNPPRSGSLPIEE